MDEISEDNRIVVRFENTMPVSLREFSSALGSLSRQYASFIKRETGGRGDIDADLRVREVREGSILLELISANVLPVIPLLWEGGSLSEWMKYLELVVRSLKEGKAPTGRIMNSEDYKDYEKILTPVSKDRGSNLVFEELNNHGTINIININSSEAAEMKIVLDQQGQLAEELVASEFQIIEQKAMRWHQAKFDPQSETGNRAVIEDISAKPLKVVFEDREVREAMQHQTSEEQIPWHELVYIVDVELELKNGEPKSYKILKYYGQPTIY